MSKSSIKAVIDAAIKQNGTKSITGPVLNSVLNQMVDEVPDVVNDKTTGGTTKAWSAEQGKDLSADVSQLAQELKGETYIFNKSGGGSWKHGQYDLNLEGGKTYTVNASLASAVTSPCYIQSDAALVNITITAGNTTGTQNVTPVSSGTYRLKYYCGVSVDVTVTIKLTDGLLGDIENEIDAVDNKTAGLLRYKNKTLHYGDSDDILQPTGYNNQFIYNGYIIGSITAGLTDYTGARFGVALWDDSGATIYDTGWKTSEYTISAGVIASYGGKYSKIVISVASPDYSVFTLEDAIAAGPYITVTGDIYYTDVKDATKKDLDGTNTRVDLVNDRANLLMNVLRFHPNLSHIFIDKINGVNVTIPSESIFDVQVSARLGFKVVEGNVHATATAGKYIVMHGEGGKVGAQLFDSSDPDNDISTVVIAETSYDTLRTYKYKALYEKYQTPVCSLEEFLFECRSNNIIPLIGYVDDTELAIVDGIMGKGNYILYGGNHSKTIAPLSFYLGSNITSKNTVMTYVNNYKAPLMISGGFHNMTDEVLLDTVKSVHEAGCLIGFAGCYDTPARRQRYWKAGFDFNGSGADVNQSEIFGNLVCLDSGIDFADFTTDGTLQADKSLLLANGEYVSFNNSGISNSFLSAGVLQIRYKGSLNISTGAHLLGDVITSNDENFINVFGDFWVNGKPSFILVATAETTIYDLHFKADKK